MATRHIITMLEKTLQVETENTISHLTTSLSDRILSQSAAIQENNCYHTIGEWYKNHFLFQQDDFLWAKYVFYDAYCEEIKKQRSSYKTCSPNIRIISSNAWKTVHCFYIKYAIP